jgi:hypothetical protein
VLLVRVIKTSSSQLCGKRCRLAESDEKLDLAPELEDRPQIPRQVPATHAITIRIEPIDELVGVKEDRLLPQIC